VPVNKEQLCIFTGSMALSNKFIGQVQIIFGSVNKSLR